MATLLRLAHSLAFGLVEAELASGGGASLQLAVLLVGVVTCWDFRASGGCSLAGRGQCCSGFFGEIVFHVGSRVGSLIFSMVLVVVIVVMVVFVSVEFRVGLGDGQANQAKEQKNLMRTSSIG